MPSIEMRFSNLIDTSYEEILNERAIEWDTSFNYVFLEGFQRLIEKTLKPKRDGHNYFDLIFLIILGKTVVAPPVMYKTYLYKATKMPMFVFTKNYLIDCNTSEKIYISDQALNELGKEFEGDFDYEFVNFTRR